MTLFTIRTLVSTVALAASVVTTAPAFAAGETAQSTSVELAGIDLASPAGQARAERKIASAARQVCGARSGLVPLGERMRTRACTDRAIDSARTRLAALTPQRGGTLVVAAQSAPSMPGQR